MEGSSDLRSCAKYNFLILNLSTEVNILWTMKHLGGPLSYLLNPEVITLSVAERTMYYVNAVDFYIFKYMIFYL